MLRKTLGERPAPSGNINHGARGKKIWSMEEDQRLKDLVESLGTGNWTLIAESLPDRTGKQCRERWHNHLGEGIKKGEWTAEEDKIIISLQKAIGNQWAKITKMLPGRTDNAVKNRFHATERAKLKAKFDDKLYTYPIDASFVARLKQLNNGADVDLRDLIDAGLLVDFSPDDPGAVHFGESVDNRPIATSVTHFPLADAAYHNNHSGHSNNMLTATPVTPPNCDEDMYDDEYDEEAAGEAALDNLMDLDIISFDEEDLDYNAPFIKNEGERGAGCCGVDIDACCSMSFDWGMSSREFSLGFGNSAFPQHDLPPEVNQEQQYHQQTIQQGYMQQQYVPQQPYPQQQQQQNGWNMCGLEAWGSHRNQEPPQQQQSQGYTATSFFCSS